MTEGEAVAVPVPVGVGVPVDVGVALSDAVVDGVGVMLELGVGVVEFDAVVDDVLDGVGDGVPVLEKEIVALDVSDTEIVALEESDTVSEGVGVMLAVAEATEADGVTLSERLGVPEAVAPTLSEEELEAVGADAIVADALGLVVGEVVGVALAPKLPVTEGEGVTDSVGVTESAGEAAPLAADDCVGVAASVELGDAVAVAPAEPGEGEGEAELCTSAALKLKKEGSVVVGAQAVGQLPASPGVMKSAFEEVSRASHMHCGKESSLTPAKSTWYT